MFLPSTGLKTKDVKRDNNSFRQITGEPRWACLENSND